MSFGRAITPHLRLLAAGVAAGLLALTAVVAPTSFATAAPLVCVNGVQQRARPGLCMAPHPNRLRQIARSNGAEQTSRRHPRYGPLAILTM